MEHENKDTEEQIAFPQASSNRFVIKGGRLTPQVNSSQKSSESTPSSTINKTPIIIVPSHKVLTNKENQSPQTTLDQLRTDTTQQSIPIQSNFKLSDQRTTIRVVPTSSMTAPRSTTPKPANSEESQSGCAAAPSDASAALASRVKLKTVDNTTMTQKPNVKTVLEYRF